MLWNSPFTTYVCDYPNSLAVKADFACVRVLASRLLIINIREDWHIFLEVRVWVSDIMPSLIFLCILDRKKNTWYTSQTRAIILYHVTSRGARLLFRSIRCSIQLSQEIHRTGNFILGKLWWTNWTTDILLREHGICATQCLRDIWSHIMRLFLVRDDWITGDFCLRSIEGQRL